MKNSRKISLVYDAMRAKEMGKVKGGALGYCYYCGRPIPGGGNDCGMCRPICFKCGKVYDPGTIHVCNGDGRW